MTPTNRRRLRYALWLSVLLGVVAVGYIAATPAFYADDVTELYVLNESGVAADYPDNLTVGETGTVIVGVNNERPRARTYTVVVRLDDAVVERYVLELGRFESDERAVSFTPQSPGVTNFTVGLYRGTFDADGPDDGNKPGWTVGFRVTVTGSAG